MKLPLNFPTVAAHLSQLPEQRELRAVVWGRGGGRPRLAHLDAGNEGFMNKVNERYAQRLVNPSVY